MSLDSEVCRIAFKQDVCTSAATSAALGLALQEDLPGNALFAYAHNVPCHF